GSVGQRRVGHQSPAEQRAPSLLANLYLAPSLRSEQQAPQRNGEGGQRGWSVSPQPVARLQFPSRYGCAGPTEPIQPESPARLLHLIGENPLPAQVLAHH